MPPSLNRRMSPSFNHNNHRNINEENVNLDETEPDETEITKEDSLFKSDYTEISNLQLVQCPVCDLNTCDGTMQVLDARHIELFLSEGFLKGKWEYKLVGSHDVRKPVDNTSGGICDIKYLKSSDTADVDDM